MARLVRFLRESPKTAAVAPLAGGALFLEAYRRIHMVEKEPASMCQLPAATRLLKAEHVRQLETEGIVVLGTEDQAISHTALAAVRAEVAGYFRKGRFSRRANGDSPTVRQDLVCWLSHTDKGLGVDMLHCMHLLRGLAHSLEVHGYSGSHDHEVANIQQLSWYPGDGVSGYVKHFDHCGLSVFQLGFFDWLRSADLRARCVTAILYLNDPEWKPPTSPRTEDDPGDGDGGELRYYHPPRGVPGSGGEELALRTDITPRGGTLVLFDAKRIQHQVLSSKRDRVALTCWITGKEGPGVASSRGVHS